MNYNDTFTPKLAKRTALCLSKNIPNIKIISSKDQVRSQRSLQRRYTLIKMMSDVSEESLLDYFYSAGGNSGKVKNADILKTFKPFIGHSDLQLRGK